jgi:hypothetical protein
VSQRFLTLIGVLAAVVAIAATAASQGPAQTPTTAATKRPAQQSEALRTPWGDPDLQGVWDSSTITPLERPAALAGKAVFTEAEAAEYERRAAARIADGSAQDRTEGIQDRAVWFEPGTKVVPDRRTSLIVDPPDGRIPPLTPEGRRRMAARAELRTHLARTDGPEDRELDDRCLIAPIGAIAPPTIPRSYNNNLQLVQTRGSVVIFHEMIHDARVVPLDGRPHLPSDIRQWMGDSRGHWDGRTLVVDTTNFAERPLIGGASPNMHLTERFTRVDATTLRYEFTVDDPSAFTKRWTAVIPMKTSAEKSRQQIYEYACHEGNYSMPHMLEAARAADKATVESATQK